jgi:hypothetical protein
MNENIPQIPACHMSLESPWPYPFLIRCLQISSDLQYIKDKQETRWKEELSAPSDTAPYVMEHSPEGEPHTSSHPTL